MDEVEKDCREEDGLWKAGRRKSKDVRAGGWLVPAMAWTHRRGPAEKEFIM